MTTRRKPENERWWVEMVHPNGYSAKVCLRWVEGRRGVYTAIIDAIEWDLFTPMPEQDHLTEEMLRWNVRAVAPLES